MALYAPFEALLAADPAGWTRVGTTSPPRWRHAHGLECQVRRGPPGMWLLGLSFGREPMVLKIPKTHTGPLLHNIAPILRDIDTWIASTDHIPRRRILQQMMAWLTWHGQTGDYKIYMNSPHSGFTIIQASNPTRPLRVLVEPPELRTALQADLQEVWQRSTIPETQRHSIHWTPSAAVPEPSRILYLNLPTTQHARLEMMALVRSELRLIPFPEPLFSS